MNTTKWYRKKNEKVLAEDKRSILVAFPLFPERLEFVDEMWLDFRRRIGGQVFVDVERTDDCDIFFRQRRKVDRRSGHFGEFCDAVGCASSISEKDQSIN
jgi:hypothetical protein